MRTWLLALTLVAAAAPAAADCSQYAEALAYNACLARQGPAARAVHLGGVEPGRPPARRPAHGAVELRHGRKEMVFSR